MSQSPFPPFFKFGVYKSTDLKHPDILQVEIVDPEPFETSYDWNVLAKIDGKETNIPLRAKSANKKLYRQFMGLLKEGKISVGTKLQIKTWLRKSNRNPTNNLRDFEVKLL